MPGFGITGKRLYANRMRSISPDCKVSAGGKSPREVFGVFPVYPAGKKERGAGWKTAGTEGECFENLRVDFPFGLCYSEKEKAKSDDGKE